MLLSESFQISTARKAYYLKTEIQAGPGHGGKGYHLKIIIQRHAKGSPPGIRGVNVIPSIVFLGDFHIGIEKVFGRELQLPMIGKSLRNRQIQGCHWLFKGVRSRRRTASHHSKAWAEYVVEKTHDRA